MTLKAIKQLTNIAWIIGGVSAATAGYSYINSRRDQVFVEYTRKPLGTISSIEDIEDYEKQKGCQFLFFTKREKVVATQKPNDYGPEGSVTRPSVSTGANGNAPSAQTVTTTAIIKTSSATLSPQTSSPAPKVVDSLNIPKYNEWNDGGVLSASNYVSKNEKRKSEVIKKAEAMKGKCERGKIIYEEIEDTTTKPTLIHQNNDSQSN